MQDLISRQAAIDIERNSTVDTNPSYFEAQRKEQFTMADENITGKRIKDLCRQKGITVRELAEKSNTTEVSMSRFITGARMPNAPILKNIAKALETTTDYLLGGDQE